MGGRSMGVALAILWLLATEVFAQDIVDQAAPAAPAEVVGRLVVKVVDLASDEGQLRFALFDSEESFMKTAAHAGIVEIQGRGGIWIVDDLPYGRYAVLVHHDVDASGKMERHWYGKPREPTGASNDAPARFGPPKFEDAVFDFGSSTLTLTVPVR